MVEIKMIEDFLNKAYIRLDDLDVYDRTKEYIDSGIEDVRDFVFLALKALEIYQKNQQ